MKRAFILLFFVMIKLMVGENTKTNGPVESAAERVKKAKVFIVGIVDGVACVFIPTRSEFEHSRIGDSDLPGGKLALPPKGSKKPRETVDEGLKREVGKEEFPGVILELITHIDTVERVKKGVPITTYIFAAIAKIPEGGIKPGLNEEGHYEHLPDGRWAPIDTIHEIEDLPRKYRTAAASETGRLALECLAQLAYDVPMQQQEEAELVLVGS